MNIRKHKIAVLTGSRAEYGILQPLLHEIELSKRVSLELLVTGMHLLSRYGNSIKDVMLQYPEARKIAMYENLKPDKPNYYFNGLARGIRNVGNCLVKIQPDILVVFGDRLEPLAAVLSAATLSIPIVHIHGGDRANNGQIDEHIRFSISRFAHVHCVACEEHKKRLLKMGGQPWRIHTVGALGLDSVNTMRIFSRETIVRKFHLETGKQFAVCLFNPVVPEAESMGRQMGEILQALEASELQTVLIYPNNDKGSTEIIRQIELVKRNILFHVIKNIPHEQFHGLLKHCDVFLGNSSSGIIEAPYLHIPFIHIGSRNLGRISAENTIFCNTNKQMIIRALHTALHDEVFKSAVRGCSSPYGNGHAAKRIVRILETIKIDERLLRKNSTY